MKVNELMIGDWVKTQPGGIQRVLGLEAGHVIVKGISVVEDYSEPIPLTAEILEKNGWYVPQAKIWWECYNVSFWLAQFVDGRFKIMTDEDSDCVFAAIRYVHELQHAFRDCGIEQELIL